MTDEDDTIVCARGERIYFRPILPEDIRRCCKWMNDPELRPLIQQSQVRGAWNLQHYYKAMDTSSLWTSRAFAIIQSDSNRHIGNIKLHSETTWSRMEIAELGILIGDRNCRTKGYGREAIDLLLKLAFTELGLRRISAHALDTNTASKKCLERCGFHAEGRLVEACTVNDTYVDAICYGLLKRHWLARQSTATDGMQSA